MNFELQISNGYQYISSRCGMKKLHGPCHGLNSREGCYVRQKSEEAA